MIDILVPKFAEGATVIRLNRWLCQLGEQVEAGEQIAEATTNKIAIYIEAPAAGCIQEFVAEPGDEVHVGQVIARLHPASSGGCGA